MAGRRRGGLAGSLLAVLAAVFKYGFLFSKFGLTAASMLVAIVAYSLLFGWAFAVGLVLLIFVHEMGHFLVARALGLPMSAPVFIPFLGAFTAAGRGLTASRRVEAITAIAGPVFGFVAALAVYLWALAQTQPTQSTGFAFSLAYFGFLITLFNLIPVLPLDGGRVASAISKWFNVAGLAIVAALIGSEVAGASTVNPILILVLIVGAYSVWRRFRAARLGQEAPPLAPGTRALIGASYVVLIGLSALLMSSSLGWLTAHQILQVS